MSRPPAVHYPRDMIGYGSHPPDPQWPQDARLSVQFVLNYEEGAENSPLHGDAGTETFLSEIIGAQSFPNRHMSMESLYEYGSRAGLWPGAAAAAFTERGDEIACHGLRWISYQQIEPVVERAHLAEAVDLLTELTRSPLLGWYTGRDSPQTRRLGVEHGGVVYDADSYADDLPYWTEVDGRQHLVVLYTLDINDMRFAIAGGFSSGEEFFTHLRDAFDVPYAEGVAGSPKMLSVGLRCRLVGRPAHRGPGSSVSGRRDTAPRISCRALLSGLLTRSGCLLDTGGAHW